MFSHRRTLTTAAAFSLAVAAAIPLAGPALAAPVQCGDVIMTSTALTADLVCTGTALTIGADGVVLDLKGHTITGPGPDPVTGVWPEANGVLIAQRSNVTVMNGTITGFHFALRPDESTGVLLTKLKTHHNLRGFDVANGSKVTVTKNEISDNAGDAVRVGGTQGGLISQNTAWNNVFGIYVADNASDFTVSRNTITGTQNAGLSAFSGASGTIFSQNVVAAGGGHGVEIQAATTGSTVSQNTVYSNAGDGILTTGPATIQQNSAYLNGRLGINATNATDGGGNKAWLNGDSRQCVGVTCSTP